ncbi:MAG: aryl-sulfate sulfotransferase [Bacteroidota bacterium]
MRTFCWLICLCWSSLAFAQFTPVNSPTYTYQWYQSGEMCDYVFLGMYRFISPAPRVPVNLILDRNGDVVWYHQSRPWMLDFKVQPNGLLSFNQNDRHYLLDSTFSLVDSVFCDGYNTDVHDLIIDEDGHYYVICYEDSIMDLSSIRTRNGTPGDSACYVLGNVVQELDENKNSVRTWHSFANYDVYTDIDSQYWTNPALIDIIHTNSLDLDDQGRMLMSHRNINEVTLVDWESGNVIWRFSGKNNDFSLPNDIGLSGQHDARFSGSDRFTVFDNGNFHPAVMSRGVEYEVNPGTMTATKVWEYARNTARSNSLGSFRILPNGNRLINFGSFNPQDQAQIALVGPDSSLIMEMDFQDTYWTYRAQCMEFPFVIERPEISCEVQNNQIVLTAQGSHPDYLWSTGDSGPSITLTDTGSYQVFVPLGIGMVGSVPIHITDLSATCPAVSTPEARQPVRRRKLMATYDMLGRPITQRRSGELYIELYDDGSTRKILFDYR